MIAAHRARLGHCLVAPFMTLVLWLAGLFVADSAAAADGAPPLQAASHFTITTSWSGVAPCLGTHEAQLASPLDAARAAEALRQLLRSSGLEPRTRDACRTSECIARKLWGEERGPWLLRIAAEYQFLAAARPGAVTQDWSEAELAEVAAAFGDLPANLFPIERSTWRGLWHNHSIEGRTGKSGHHDVVALSGEGAPGVLIGEAWHRLRPHERRAAIVHELAHEFARARGRSFDWKSHWAEVAMLDEQAAVRGGLGSSRVSQYAHSNIDEDFAESVVAYRYLAPAVKRRAPHRYAFLKEWMFDGLEYGAAATCQPHLARSLRVRSLADAALEMNQLPVETVQKIQDACATRLDRPRCIIRAAYAHHYRRAWDEHPARFPSASSSALDALLGETDFLDSALAGVSQAQWRELALYVSLEDDASLSTETSARPEERTLPGPPS